MIHRLLFTGEKMARATAVKEGTILMSTPLVDRSIVGLKTQTRRWVDNLRGFGRVSEFGRSDTRGYDWCFRDKGAVWNEIRTPRLLECCPYGGPGRRLWVRESFYEGGEWGRHHVGETGEIEGRWYPNGQVHYGEKMPAGGASWRRIPSIHMPRRRSRITIELTAVRVEQLCLISEEDVEAEGFDEAGADQSERLTASSYGYSVPKHRFACRWERLNGSGSWGLDPFVWVLSYRVV